MPDNRRIGEEKAPVRPPPLCLQLGAFSIAQLQRRASEAQIAARCDNAAGPLPAATAASRARLGALNMSRDFGFSALSRDMSSAIR